MSYRAGYRYEESPQGVSNNDLKGFSLGIGYKINNSRIDLSFEKHSLKLNHRMYDAGLVGDINIAQNNSIIKLSVVSVL